MDNKSWKSFILATTYVSVMVLIVINFKFITAAMGNLIDIFEPFFFGIVIAFIFNRPCMFIERKLSKKLLEGRNQSLKRGLSMLICYSIFFVAIVVIGTWLIPQLIVSTKDILKNFQGYAENMQAMVNQLTAYFGLKEIQLQSLFNWTAAYADKMATSITGILEQVVNLSATGMIMIAKLLFSIVFSVYFLFGKEKLLNEGESIFSTYMSEKSFKRLSHIYKIVTSTFENYLIGQTIEALILTAICFGGMLVFGFKYPVLISALVGLTALVPMVGPYIGGLIGFRILVVIDPVKAIWFIVFLIVLQQLEGDVIYPRIVGSRVGLPGVWVLLAISIGAGVAGVAGIVLGVPVASVIYTLLKEDVEKKAVRK